MTIQERIKGLLTTSTGKAMLDSGDAYGRHWERNQGVDFEAKPKYEVSCYYNEKDNTTEVSVEIDLYHYLIENLSIAGVFDCLNDLPGDDREELFEEIFEYEDKVMTNTYNYECNLSQVLQFVEIIYKDNAFILLQVHQGCDVRGGYTRAMIFAVDDIGFGFPNTSMTHLTTGKEYEGGWALIPGYVTKDEIEIY